MNVARLQPYFLLALLGAALLLTSFILWPFFAPLVLAAVFATVFQPIYKRILKALGGKHRSTASLLTVVCTVVLVLVPLAFLGTRIVVEAEQLYATLADGTGKAYLDTALQYIDTRVAGYFPGSESVAATASANIDTYAKSGLTWLLGYLGSAFSGLAGLLLKLFIFFIALYYLLRDGASLKQKIIELSPLADSDDKEIFSKLGKSVHSVVVGNLSIALIQGALTSVGFLIFGVPNAILWGSLTAIAALIPGIGTALVLLPAIIFLFITGHTVAGIGLLVWGVLAVGLVDNFLGPKLIGHGSGLHPLLVLVAVLGGLSVFGPLGIFLGPLTISFLLALLSIYSSASAKVG